MSSRHGGHDALGLAIRWVFPSQRGKLTPLDRSGVIVGRDECADTVLHGSEASRRHATLERSGCDWTLRDLGSTNGSLVDGQRVSEAPIKAGSVVRLGEWVGVVTTVSADAMSKPLFREVAPGMWGGPKLDACLDEAKRVAATDLPVVVQGETGCGKEGVARAIHGWSGRSGKFGAVNCAALPEALAEGELFGFRQGAFTGADRNHTGHFRAAHRGTLLLDEVVDLPPSTQAKLLRVLEQREVQPLGDSSTFAVDVRIVAAAQQPLSDACERRTFRADLYARLDGLTVVLPPLRDRPEDAVPLFRHFVNEAMGGRALTMEPKFAEALTRYDWPFNVRELLLLSQRLTALHGHETQLRYAHLPQRMRSALEVPEAPPEVSDLERLLAELRTGGGNVAQAARRIGVSRQRAYRLMNEADVDLGAIRSQP